MTEISLQAVLAEVQGYETATVALYRQGHALVGTGQLTSAIQAGITQHGERLFMMQQAVYSLVVAMVRAVPGGEAYVSQIPRPVRLPAPTAAMPGPGLNGGLGALPAIPIVGWVAGVVVVIAAIAAIAWILTEAVAGGQRIVRDIMQQREESQRYRECLASSADPAACVAVAPPHAPAPPPSRWGWIAFGAVGVIALGALGYYGWRRYQGGSTIEGLQAFPRQLKTGKMREPALRRALAGGYNMEVEP